MSISVLSWNIQEFGKRIKGESAARRRNRLDKRLAVVAQHIRDQAGDNTGPDIFGLLEIEDMDLLELMQTEFPAYDFSITDGERKKKEIIVGHRRDRFAQVAFTQKRQFDLRNPYLRPGALLSVRQDTTWLNLLFLHTDSGTEARDFGNRYEMFDKVWSLRKGLDKKVPDRESLVVLGDLNTMGLMYPLQRKSNQLVTGESEVTALDRLTARNAMKRLDKSHDSTWKKRGRNMTSDLDHVLASDHMAFATLGNTAAGAPFEVRVTGWVDLTPAKREAFLRNVSDHCSVYVEIQ